MNIFRKKSNIIEPQEPEPVIDSEPNGECEPCPGETLDTNYDYSHAVGFSNQCFSTRSFVTGYYSREEENK